MTVDIVFSYKEWGLVILGLILSLVLSNILAMYMQGRREVRIKDKSRRLANETLTTKKIPVTVLTGFLGSGKTTMLNDILSSKEHKLKIAIIENEAGAISIDHELLHHMDAEKGVYVMENGCMCCSSGGEGDELERVLNKMLDIMDDESYDYLIIETSGLVDPTPILQTFFTQEMRGGRYELDAVITLVDAKNIGRHLKGGRWGVHTPEAERQISLADVIVINKTDLISPDDLSEVVDSVQYLNPMCSMIQTSFSKVNPLSILDIKAFTKEKILQRMPDILTQSPSHGKHVSSVAITSEDPITLESFQRWSKELLDTYYTDIYRMKGILNVAGSENRFVVQGVSTELHGEMSKAWGAGEGRRTTVIVIGKKLSAEDIRSSFHKVCGVKDSSSSSSSSSKEGGDHQESCDDPHCDGHDHDHDQAHRGDKKVVVRNRRSSSNNSSPMRTKSPGPDRTAGGISTRLRRKK